jgi:hypothetical protein
VGWIGTLTRTAQLNNSSVGLGHRHYQLKELQKIGPVGLGHRSGSPQLLFRRRREPTHTTKNHNLPSPPFKGESTTYSLFLHKEKKGRSTQTAPYWSTRRRTEGAVPRRGSSTSPPGRAWRRRRKWRCPEVGRVSSAKSPRRGAETRSAPCRPRRTWFMQQVKWLHSDAPNGENDARGMGSGTPPWLHHAGPTMVARQGLGHLLGNSRTCGGRRLPPGASPSSRRLSDEWLDVAASGGRGNK